MSSSSQSRQGKNPLNYVSGADRYVDFSNDFLGLRLAEKQKEVLRQVAQNQRTLIWGGNGPGKSYIIAALKLAFLYSNSDSIVLGTSGSYQQYEDTMWRPLEDMHENLKNEHGLPGETKGGNRPRLEIDNEWYAKIVSPREPGELEGRHNDDVLIVIDEADKKYVTWEHFDSAGSSITDRNDKMVAIANPPKEDENIVAKKKEDKRWNVIELSAFDSHNALVDAGKINESRIPGLVDLITIAGDYEAWNKREWPLANDNYPHGDWPGMAEIAGRLDDKADPLSEDDVLPWLAPGFDVAKEAHKRFDTLDERWYIRRAGVMPPSGADTYKPIKAKAVRSSYERGRPSNYEPQPRTVGIDVARSGDKTVMVGEHNMELRVHYAETGANHEAQKRDILQGTATTPALKRWADSGIAVDKGYAPGFHDYIADKMPNVVDFQNGTKALEETRWYDKWAEGLFHLGQWLDDGGVINDLDLRDELMVAARTIEFSERTLNSRGSNGAEVYEATSKDDIREELGHSPDFLDAALMAVWRLRTSARSRRINSTWYDPHART